MARFLRPNWQAPGKLVQLYSYRVSFQALGVVALAALALLWIAMPETLASHASPAPLRTASPRPRAFKEN